MNYISFFSGIGGFELAIQRSFGDKAKCVGFSEIEPIAVSVYQDNFPDHTSLGDITKVTNEQIVQLYKDNGGIDLIVGGFPCQNLSNIAKIKGDGRGLEGPQSGLFYDLVRIMSVIYKLNNARKKDTHFILENVRSTKIFRDAIQQHLSSLFGSVYETELNSKYFSAQTRIRYVWTNFEVKPVPTATLVGPTLSEVLEPPSVVIKRIREIQYSERMIRMLNKWLEVKSANPSKIGHYQAVCEAEDKKGVRLCNFVPTTPPAPTMRCRWPRYAFSDTNNSKSNTVLSHFPHVLVDRRFGKKGFIARGLFLCELERLFTFPVGWTKAALVGKKFGSPASDTTGTTKLLGNSVVVKALQYVTDQLKDRVTS